MEKPMLKIKIGAGAPSENMEEQPGIEESHEAHMGKVESGLNQILQSTNIQEIHSIAQSLLSEEKKEESVESEQPKFDFKSKAMEALKGESNSAGA